MLKICCIALHCMYEPQRYCIGKGDQSLNTSFDRSMNYFLHCSARKLTALDKSVCFYLYLFGIGQECNVILKYHSRYEVDCYINVQASLSLQKIKV